jgi:hypothetical protein
VEEKFEIRDRRRIDVEGEIKPSAAAPAMEKAHAETEAEEPLKEPAENRLFVPFVMNLAGMAYMAMGLGEVPAEPNLPEAKYIIDVVGMLGEKTRGNLSAREEKALEGILFELRMNFSKAAGKKKP